MSKASEALADVRGWLCDNLSKGDAGKVCGMLSVVSRHIVELEDENARIRSCLSNDADNARQIIEENFKMRELCTDMHAWMGRALYENSVRRHEYESITDCMDDLGVPHD